MTYVDLDESEFKRDFRIAIQVGDELREVDIKAGMRVRIVLELRPHAEPLRVTIERRMVRDFDDEEPAEAAAYLYEEHLCAESIFNEVSAVSLGDQNDPHGLFELIEYSEGEPEK